MPRRTRRHRSKSKASRRPYDDRADRDLTVIRSSEIIPKLLTAATLGKYLLRRFRCAKREQIHTIFSAHRTLNEGIGKSEAQIGGLSFEPPALVRAILRISKGLLRNRARSNFRTTVSRVALYHTPGPIYGRLVRKPGRAGDLLREASPSAEERQRYRPLVPPPPRKLADRAERAGGHGPGRVALAHPTR